MILESEYSCLSISREEFREIYENLPILEYEDLFFTKPTSQDDIFYKYLPSKLWRLNNLYTIVDKWGDSVIFRMNRAQHIVYSDSLRHPRLIILKSRQQGISTLWLVSFFDDLVFIANLSIGLMAQGLDEAETLLERTKFLWDQLHEDIKNFMNVRLINNNTKLFSLSNKSKIFIRTSFRSTTLQRLHISEMGKIANKTPEKAKETKTGTLQALAQGNTGVVESTAEGDNMFKDMWDVAVSHCHQLSLKDFKPIFLSWLDDPDCVLEIDQVVTTKVSEYFKKLETSLNKKLTREQKNFWIAQYRELGEKIYQEYPSTAIEAFMATKQGAYYAEQYMEWVVGYKREIENLYDPNLDVQIAIDLGMNDTNVLGPFQTYGKETRIIDEFYDSGQPIKYYCDWIKKQPWFHNLTHVILPHDAEVKEMTSGKKRIEVFQDELREDLNGNPTNIYFTVLERTSVQEGIDQVRQMIGNLYMDKKVEYIKSCIINYKKEWNEKAETWRDKPLHDEFSNGADCVRYIAIGQDKSSRNRHKINKEINKQITNTQSIYNQARGNFDV